MVNTWLLPKRRKNMRAFDARHLCAEAQHELRRRVIHAVVDCSLKPAVAARLFGVGRTALYNWLHDYYTAGYQALAPHPRGRPHEPKLKGYQAATIVRLISRCFPSQLHLPFALWSREAIQQLIALRTGLHLSVWTVGRYLKRWGFTPQKPLRRAYEQDPKAVRRWLEQEYPVIRERAKQEKAEIHWLDEMGLRSQDQRGRSYGRRGRTPVIPCTSQRFGCNMISTITNHGHLTFMVFEQAFRTPVLLRFLRRLVRQAGRKLFVILDQHPVHQAMAIERWVQQHACRIQLFPLPTASPELNPGEYLNQDVKSNAVGRQRPHNKQEMLGDVRSYMRSTQRQPEIVKGYFEHPSAKYARY
jgi:transposase